MQDYFSHAVFKKLFEAIRKKYRSLGRVGGAVKLAGLSPTESDELTGFLGRDCRDRPEVTVGLQEVDAILRQSRFAITLAEFLPLYFGTGILSNKEAALLTSRQWTAFFAALREQACNALTGAWLDELAAGRGAGYRTILTLYRQNEPGTAALLSACVEAMDSLVQHPAQRQRLPVFAAVLTGDPHALDGDKPLGRLLFFGLHHLYGLSETEYGAEKRKELFSRAGLAEDDLSSNVIVAGLRVCPGDPREAIFSSPAANPLLLPLRFLEQPTGWLPTTVYTLENPAVFSSILDFAGGRAGTAAGAGPNPDIPALVCTSGQPSVAALKLLDQLVEAGCTICYGGDFDPGGLEIGRRLAKRYGPSFKPWFFDTAAYLQAPKGVKLTPEQLKKLAGRQVPWDSMLIATMLQSGRAVYQEILVESMIKDLFPFS